MRGQQLLEPERIEPSTLPSSLFISTRFGHSVEIENVAVVAGAPDENDLFFGNQVGTVYVFEAEANGSFSETDKLNSEGGIST